MLEVIRDEFEEEINTLKLQEIEYQDSKNRKQPMFKPTTNQARQLKNILENENFRSLVILEFLNKIELIMV